MKAFLGTLAAIAMIAWLTWLAFTGLPPGATDYPGSIEEAEDIEQAWPYEPDPCAPPKRLRH